MDSQPLYIQIGAILGILSSIILLILEFTRFYKTIRGFYSFVLRIMKLMWENIRCWYWWRRCQPTWRIVKLGQVEIIERDGEYIQFTIKMSAEISYHNSDDRYTLSISRSPFLLLYHNGKGKSAEPFRLSTELTGGREIKPLGDYSINYFFHSNVWARPDISDVTVCKFKEYGDAIISTHSHNLSGKIKRVGKSKKTFLWYGGQRSREMYKQKQHKGSVAKKQFYKLLDKASQPIKKPKSDKGKS